MHRPKPGTVITTFFALCALIVLGAVLTTAYHKGQRARYLEQTAELVQEVARLAGELEAVDQELETLEVDLIALEACEAALLTARDLGVVNLEACGPFFEAEELAEAAERLLEVTVPTPEK